VLVPPVFVWSDIEAPMAAYVEEARAHGHTPDIVFIRALYLDEDRAQARREAEAFLHNFLAFNAAPVATLPSKDELERKGYGAYTGGRLERLARLSYAEILEQGIAFVGTPEEVAAQMAPIGRIPGVTEISMIANFGGIEHWKAIKTMELFHRRVMPLLRQAER
jgi:alkanesulfonate monooxygenase SsuD/methylene tetrahydromethanopterin reductase-like flavin-dependent oxidoreductase (luciferase family)